MWLSGRGEKCIVHAGMEAARKLLHSGLLGKRFSISARWTPHHTPGDTLSVRLGEQNIKVGKGIRIYNEAVREDMLKMWRRKAEGESDETVSSSNFNQEETWFISSFFYTAVPISITLLLFLKTLI